MYGLPKNIDLSHLLQRELLQVCIGFNDLILRFDERILITITGECSYITNDEVVTEIESYCQSANLFCRLLGNKILEVIAQESGNLSLKFSNRDILMLRNDSTQFESFVIESPSGNIIV